MSKWTKTSFHLTHATKEVHWVWPKKISMPVVHLAQTLHLFWTKINTISKWIEVCFHLTHVTKKFHLVRPKQFQSLLHVRGKPCPYLE
jgi:hypothetical protein